MYRDILTICCIDVFGWVCDKNGGWKSLRLDMKLIRALNEWFVHIIIIIILFFIYLFPQAHKNLA